MKQVIAPCALLIDSPARPQEAASELLFGERVEILQEARPDGWTHVHSQTDGYEGYVQACALEPDIHPPTHEITALHSFLYPAPDFKAYPTLRLPFLSRLTLTGKQESGFAELVGGGWIWAGDIAPLEMHAPDIVATTLRFLDAPYKWGGRTPAGLDCSALVQLSVLAAGHPCPRDTKDQILTLGQEIPPHDLKRGDFVFFKGHVGIMIDDQNILNATARHMRTVIENLEAVTTAYGGILKVRRL